MAIVRQTLKQLKDTVLKDCQAWLGGGLGEWKVSENTFHLELRRCAERMDFHSARGCRRSGAAAVDAVDVVVGCRGHRDEFRYPRRRSRAVSAAILGASAAPRPGMGSSQIPTCQLSERLGKFMENPPPDWQVFRQPSGIRRASGKPELSPAGRQDHQAADQSSRSSCAGAKILRTLHRHVRV